MKSRPPGFLKCFNSCKRS